MLTVKIYRTINDTKISKTDIKVFQERNPPA